MQPDAAQMSAHFTPEGMRRLMCIDPGPCFVVAARMVMEPDGREAPVTHVPEAEPATQGRTRFILSAPPGGGWMRSADLLAEDETVILRVNATPPVHIPDGGTLLIPVELS